MSDHTASPSKTTPDHPSALRDKTAAVRAGSGERFSEKLYLAITVAALSFAGSAGGTLLTFRAETSRWERETNYSQRNEILSKRMELLERTIRIMNHLQTLDMYKSVGDYSLVEGESTIRRNKSATPSLEPAVDSVVKVKEAQAELSVMMTLDALYFGPKTKEAISDLNKALKVSKPWWKVDELKTQKVVETLYDELDFGLK